MEPEGVWSKITAKRVKMTTKKPTSTTKRHKTTTRETKCLQRDENNYNCHPHFFKSLQQRWWVSINHRVTMRTFTGNTPGLNILQLQAILFHGTPCQERPSFWLSFQVFSSLFSFYCDEIGCVITPTPPQQPSWDMVVFPQFSGVWERFVLSTHLGSRWS